MLHRLLLFIHLTGAAIWVGGHLVLALRFLPLALRTRSAAVVRTFEERFEPIGMTALAAQIITGFFLAQRLLPIHSWFDFRLRMAMGITAKFACLLATALLAVDARFRVIPKLTDENLRGLAWHIRLVTLLGLGFVLAGISIRTGGLID